MKTRLLVLKSHLLGDESALSLVKGLVDGAPKPPGALFFFLLLWSISFVFVGSASRSDLVRDFTDEKKHYVFTYGEDAKSELIMTDKYGRSYVNVGPKELAGYTYFGGPLPNYYFTPPKPEPVVKQTESMEYPVFPDTRPIFTEIRPMGSFGKTTHLGSGTYSRDTHAREAMSHGGRDTDARSSGRILVESHSRGTDRRGDISDRTRMWAETRRMRPSQVAKCMPKKYGRSGDPYAHVSLFKQVLRAEQITDFHTQYEGFGLTLEGTALTWFQPLDPKVFPNIDNVLREFAEEFSKRVGSASRSNLVRDFTDEKKHYVFTYGEDAKSELIMTDKYGRSYVNVGPKELAGYTYFGGPLPNYYFTPPKPEPIVKQTESMGYPVFPDTRPVFTEIRPMGSFGKTTHLGSGTYSRDTHAREAMSHGGRDTDARSSGRIPVESHSKGTDRWGDISDRTRMWAETRRMRPSQVAKCMPKKYGRSGDPYAHVSLFKQVLRAEQITDFHTQYEGFGLTLKGTALTWFQPLDPKKFPNIDNVLREFTEEFSKRGIKHNTVSQIYAFKQRENEKVKEASLRFKQYTERCPRREPPQDERLSVIFMEGLRNEMLKKDLHLKACSTFEHVTREALYLVNNCKAYGEVNEDANSIASDTSSVKSEPSTKKDPLATPTTEQMIEEITKRIQQQMENLAVKQSQMRKCNICGGDHPTPWCTQQPKAPIVTGRVLKWCAVEQKWINHGTEECFYNKNYVRERPYGSPTGPPQPPPPKYQVEPNVNAVVEADRPQLVLGQQPPLPHENRAMIKYAQPYEAPQPMNNAPMITYYEKPNEPYITEPEQLMYADEPYQSWGMNEEMAPPSYVAQPSRDQYLMFFIDDIPGELPPKQGDDENAIELIPGSSPPKNPPYRVSQAQQEEIMKQVNELVEKGMVEEQALGHAGASWNERWELKPCGLLKDTSNPRAP
ncbi:hypothetical protein L7F22_016259 [Adiantum nelumboides]|nr:hypothetical protein [Adiantum nelumboides]